MRSMIAHDEDSAGMRLRLLLLLLLLQVLDFLLIMDIILQFFRAYINKKSVLVVQLGRIRRNYLGQSQPGTLLA